jgi:hypothetical protein
MNFFTGEGEDLLEGIVERGGSEVVIDVDHAKRESAGNEAGSAES